MINLFSHKVNITKKLGVEKSSHLQNHFYKKNLNNTAVVRYANNSLAFCKADAPGFLPLNISAIAPIRSS